MLPTTAQGSSVVGTSATPSSTSFWKRSGISSFFHTLAGWFTVLSSVCSPALPATTTSLLVAPQRQHSGDGWFYHEWIADSGAGRSLESRDALIEQGIPEDVFTNMTEQAPTIAFSTGNGVVDSGLMLGFEGSAFGNNAAYLLDSCPSVKSLGELVETKSMPFVWIPGKLPMFLPECAHVQVIEDNAIHADRVEGNVPIFREQVRFITPSAAAMPGFMSDARKAKPTSTTDDQTLWEFLHDRGVPSDTAAVILIQLHVDCQRLRSEHLLPRQKHQAPRLLRRQRPPLRYLPKRCQSQNHLCLHQLYLLSLMQMKTSQPKDRKN